MVQKLTGGGAERVASLWATGFVERGHEVGIVLNCKKSTPITYAVPESVELYNLSQSQFKYEVIKRINYKSILDFYYINKLKKILRKFNPDIAIGVLPPWAEWTRRAARGMDIKIINTEHNTFEKPKGALYSPMSKTLIRQKFQLNKNYHHVTVLTEADKKCTEGILYNVSVLPNPLTFKPLSYLPPKKNIILAAGRLNAWYVKGFDLLVNAWGDIAKQYPNWKLQIAGKDNESIRNSLLHIAMEKGVDSQIEFIGYQYDMQHIYQQAAIFVLSSRYEGFGMVLIEAMSQGCAPIACDYKNRQKEIITSEDEGLICPVNNCVAISSALRIMIENEKYRELVQKHAIERSKFYTLDNIMNRWNVIFNNTKQN